MVEFTNQDEFLAKAKKILKREIDKPEEFTVSEAIEYWENCFSAECRSVTADIESAKNMFYEGYKNGDLKLCKLTKYDRSKYYPYRTGSLGYMGAPITIDGVEYEFDNCMVTRESLIRFAYVVDEYPLFLFPNGKPEENDDKTEDVETDNNGGGVQKQEQSKDDSDAEDKIPELLNNRLTVIVEILRSLGYNDDLFNLPRFTCAKVRVKCLSDHRGEPLNFTESTYQKVWQDGLNLKRFRTKDHFKYSKKKKKNVT